MAMMAVALETEDVLRRDAGRAGVEARAAEAADAGAGSRTMQSLDVARREVEVGLIERLSQGMSGWGEHGS